MHIKYETPFETKTTTAIVWQKLTRGLVSKLSEVMLLVYRVIHKSVKHF
jgi:hypothetical protein